MNLIPLETLDERAVRHAYTLEDVDWSKDLDRERWFFPEHLTPLYHCPAYTQVLNPDERLRYNQLYGQSINEQFIFLEDRFLIQMVRGLKKRGKTHLPGLLWKCLDMFVEEEVKHTEMFRQLARRSVPGRYEKSDYYFMKLGRLESALLDMVAGRPDFFVFWIWMGSVFEEKTIDYYLQYKAHEKARPEHALEPLYQRVHHFHMLDETRHVQIDHHLLSELYDSCGRMTRGLNVEIFARAMKSYTTPKRTNIRIIDELVRTTPRLDPFHERLCAEVRTQKGTAPYQLEAYARKNLPKTFELFDRYPEMKRMASAIATYDRQPPT